MTTATTAEAAQEATLDCSEGEVISVRQAFDGESDRPKPEWVRGTCPKCSEPLVSNCYYKGGVGHFIAHECWASLQDNPTCDYRKVLK